MVRNYKKRPRCGVMPYEVYNNVANRMERVNCPRHAHRRKVFVDRDVVLKSKADCYLYQEGPNGEDEFYYWLEHDLCLDHLKRYLVDKAVKHFTAQQVDVDIPEQGCQCWGVEDETNNVFIDPHISPLINPWHFRLVECHPSHEGPGMLSGYRLQCNRCYRRQRSASKRIYSNTRGRAFTGGMVDEDVCIRGKWVTVQKPEKVPVREPSDRSFTTNGAVGIINRIARVLGQSTWKYVGARKSVDYGEEGDWVYEDERTPESCREERKRDFVYRGPIWEMRQMGYRITTADEEDLRDALYEMRAFSKQAYREFVVGANTSLYQSAMRDWYRNWVLRRLSNTCPSCQHIVTDHGQWVIDWVGDNAVCLACRREGARVPFLETILPCGALMPEWD